MRIDQAFCEKFLKFALNKNRPILDVSFPAAQTGSINCEGNCLETSPFCSSNKLCNHISILVDLRTDEQHLMTWIQWPLKYVLLVCF